MELTQEFFNRVFGDEMVMVIDTQNNNEAEEYLVAETPYIMDMVGLTLSQAFMTDPSNTFLGQVLKPIIECTDLPRRFYLGLARETLRKYPLEKPFDISCDNLMDEERDSRETALMAIYNTAYFSVLACCETICNCVLGYSETRIQEVFADFVYNFIACKSYLDAEFDELAVTPRIVFPADYQEIIKFIEDSLDAEIEKMSSYENPN